MRAYVCNRFYSLITRPREGKGGKKGREQVIKHKERDVYRGSSGGGGGRR